MEKLGNQQRSTIESQSVKLLTRTEKKKGKWYGLYLCPSCNKEVELRIDTVITHIKKKDYPKLCSACNNKLAGQKRIKHGDIDTRLYSIWCNMNSRTSDYSIHTAYKNINVCNEWKSFIIFKEWAIANGYTDDLTIDRIDPNKDYTPKNCRWLSLSENSARANRRGEPNSRAKIPLEEIPTIITLSKTMTHTKIAEKYGVARTTITAIINSKRSTTIPTGSTPK